MESNWATEHLQVIRTLMERSAVYRRALAPIMTYCGVVGIAAGLMGWQFKIESDRDFVVFWASVAAAALLGSLLLVRRQALKDAEPFWSPPTRRIAQAMMPPLAVGLFISIAIGGFSAETSDSINSHILVMAWALLYGCALHAAGFFVSRGVRILGWIFCACGCVLLAEPWTGWYLPPHLQMAVLFGGLHLACGIYLYFTEKRGNET